jgi:heme/copper-type cytochrome/quinol oxidase subunit 4
MEQILDPNSSQLKKRGAFLTEKRWLLFVWVPLFTIAFEMVGMIMPQKSDLSTLISLFLAIGLNVAAFAWCRMDSRERRYELHRFFPFAVIIFGWLALIYYLFRSRGARGGLISTAWFALYAILLFLGAIIVDTILLTALMVFGIIPPQLLDR